MDLIRFVAMVISTSKLYHVFCPKKRFLFSPFSPFSKIPISLVPEGTGLYGSMR